MGCETAELAYWAGSYSLVDVGDDPWAPPFIRLMVIINGQTFKAQVAADSPLSLFDETAARCLEAWA
ncbi:hypothetical protein VPG91_25485 [Nitrospirillum amazonense]|uniref:hypothetical protein n=1 Tax=Nitrospirillum amazonense TaxID=28077 RepID=UPI002DD41E24|nr:hypothetical protein [Nitrospirillum amazonense]MEC4594374.1 hypothetical protein [Nitrospirillum amazonense]